MKLLSAKKRKGKSRSCLLVLSRVSRWRRHLSRLKEFQIRKKEPVVGPSDRQWKAFAAAAFSISIRAFFPTLKFSSLFCDWSVEAMWLVHQPAQLNSALCPALFHFTSSAFFPLFLGEWTSACPTNDRPPKKLSQLLILVGCSILILPSKSLLPFFFFFESHIAQKKSFKSFFSRRVLN